MESRKPADKGIVTKPEALSSAPRSHTGGGEHQLLYTLFWLSHVWCCGRVTPHTWEHNKQIHVIKISKNWVYHWIGHLSCCWGRVADWRKGWLRCAVWRCSPPWWGRDEGRSMKRLAAWRAPSGGGWTWMAVLSSLSPHSVWDPGPCNGAIDTWNESSFLS